MSLLIRLKCNIYFIKLERIIKKIKIIFHLLSIGTQLKRSRLRYNQIYYNDRNMIKVQEPWIIIMSGTFVRICLKIQTKQKIT